MFFGFSRRSFALLASFLLVLEPTTTARSLGQSSSTLETNSNQGQTNPLPLQVGIPIEKEITGDEAHSYQITLQAGQYLHAVVDQRGINVAVTLFAPDGKPLVSSDSPNQAIGPEPVSVIAEVSGTYRLEVRVLETWKAVTGRYQATIEQLRLPTEQDRNLIAAERAFMEATQLRIQNAEEPQRQAIAKYLEALPVFQTAGDRYWELLTLRMLSDLYSGLSEQQKALDSYNQLLVLYREMRDRAGEADILKSIGYIYSNLGDNQKALDYLNQSLPLWRELGELPESDRTKEAETLNTIGYIYSNLGDNQKALDYLNQALQLWQTVANHLEEARTLTHIGNVYQDLGDNQKARDYYNRASANYADTTNTNSPNSGSDSSKLGEEYYNQALQFWRAVGDRYGEAATLYTLASLSRDQGNLTAALTQIEASLTIIEDLRTQVASQELRTFYFATVQNYYELYIDLLMQLHKQNPSQGYDTLALQASERARSRSLLELLSESGTEIRQGVDPQLLEEERTIEQQLNVLAKQQIELLNSAHTEEQVTALNQQIETLLKQYQELQGQIRQVSPRYAAMTQPQPLTLAQIQQQVLDKDTLLLQYYLGKERSYVWAVTPTSITSYELSPRAAIEDAARNFRDSLAAPTLVMRLKEAIAAGQALSQLILEPVSSQLGQKRLLIVSDGALQYIPFSALPVPENHEQGGSDTLQTRFIASRNNSSLVPLIVEHEIISLPSVSSLAVLRREVAGRKPAPKTIAVIADPVFDRNDERLQGTLISQEPSAANSSRTLLQRSANDIGIAGEIQRLPFTKQEAQQILSLVPETERLEALDFRANRQTVTSLDLSQYRIVHFATHGFLNSLHPELSGLVLSLVDGSGAPVDGFLRLHDIYNLNLPADLVVLSACETGLGEEIKGEGLIGLTRGFMYAGAERVLVSSWRVDDEATAQLMGKFYQGMLKEGLRPAAALRAAQLAMWQQQRWRAPYYWAAFTLQGEWR